MTVISFNYCNYHCYFEAVARGNCPQASPLATKAAAVASADPPSRFFLSAAPRCAGRQNGAHVGGRSWACAVRGGARRDGRRLQCGRRCALRPPAYSGVHAPWHRQPIIFNFLLPRKGYTMPHAVPAIAAAEILTLLPRHLPRLPRRAAPVAAPSSRSSLSAASRCAVRRNGAHMGRSRRAL